MNENGKRENTERYEAFYGTIKEKEVHDDTIL